MKVQKLFDLVKRLLEEKPERRNSDKKLMWAVWYKLGYATEDEIRFYDFLGLKCPTPESITRCRRKIQENFPHLKGSRKVQELRAEKESEKGTFVYREKALKKK